MKFGWEKKYPFVEDFIYLLLSEEILSGKGIISSFINHFSLNFYWKIFIVNSTTKISVVGIYFTSSHLVRGKNKTSGFVCLILSLNFQVQDLYKHLKPNQPNQSLTNFYTTSPKSFYSGVLEFCFCQIPKFLKPYVWPK